MFFLLAIWVFILTLGLFYIFFFQHFEIAFIGIHPFGGYGDPEKDQVLLALLGLFSSSPL